MFERLPLFSYGTLREADTQRELFGRTVATTLDALPGFTLEDIELTEADGSPWMHFIAVRSPKGGDRINGARLELSNKELAAADRYEPEPYTRIEATLASGKRAWVYVHRDKT